MGQQINKIQKRRRRAAYVDRLKAKAKAAVVAKPAVKKKAAPAKKTAGAVAAPVEAAAE